MAEKNLYHVRVFKDERNFHQFHVEADDPKDAIELGAWAAQRVRLSGSRLVKVYPADDPYADCIRSARVEIPEADE